MEKVSGEELKKIELLICVCVQKLLYYKAFEKQIPMFDIHDHIRFVYGSHVVIFLLRPFYLMNTRSQNNERWNMVCYLL